MTQQEDDGIDSLVRAVAAAPAVRPEMPPVFAILLRVRQRGDATARVSRLATPFGGVVAAAPDGALAITWVGHHRAADAASCVLALRKDLSGARLALVLGKAEGPRNLALDALLERAAGLLERGAERQGVAVDDATASMLDAGFDVRGDPGARVLVARRTAPANGGPRRELVDTSALDLVAWGLRFENAGTEAAYREWHRAKAVPFTRLGMLLSILNWLSAIAASKQINPAGYGTTIALVLCFPMPVIVAALVISYWPRRLRWLLPCTSLANAVAGLAYLLLVVRINSLPEMALPGTVLIAFFGFTIFRMLPSQAVLATLPYVGLCQWFLVRAFLEAPPGRVAFGDFLTSSILLGATFVTGTLACMTIDRIARSGYRQERIVDAQREVIDRLQEAELKRQVAERSRVLSEALSRLGDGPTTSAHPAAGDLVEGRYQIIRTIGAGGMGQVFEVERLSDGRRLALKMLAGIGHREALARFAREAQIAAELDHPNVVAAVDFGITGTNSLFLVMQLVVGPSLAAERARYGKLAWALPLLAQTARALEAMHARGVVHRDLKPANILIEGHVVKVADFGLACLREDLPFTKTGESGAGPSTQASPGLTHSGAIMGTPLYMAPELARGAREAGPAADVFSFGVVAFELLTKELPHTSPPVLERVMGRALSASPSLIEVRPDLPAALCELVDRCLAFTPDARPSADAIASELARLEAACPAG